MILVDTCGWIEWLTDGVLADSFAPYMKDPSDLLVPTTVQWPDLDFLSSRDAALPLSRAEAIAKAKPSKRHLVFAPARFVSQRMLNENNLPVEFAPLPFALYRVERSL